MNTIVLECKHLNKFYQEGTQRVEVLRDVNFSIETGKKVAIVGASGSGKSTLLNVLGGLDRPSSGEVYIKERLFSALSDNERGYVRNQSLGFVYQFHHLLPEFTAAENVAMPLRIAGMKAKLMQARVELLLERVGLAHRLTHKPAQLSGGERQRVAIARALAAQPDCVLLDEPTGNLDKKNAQNIHALIDELAAELNTSFVVVTHDEQFAGTLDQVFLLEDGMIEQRA